MTKPILLLAAAATLYAAPPAPELALSANGRATLTLAPGQPLIVTVSVMHPAAAVEDEALRLPAVDGSWARALRVSLHNPDGEPLDVTLHLHPPPDTALELAPGEHADVHWSVSPEAVAAIPPGAYTIRVILDTTTSAIGNEWNGRAALDELPVQIVSEPAPPEQTLRLLAEYALLRDAIDDALHHIGAWLQLQPENALAHAWKGEVLDRAGQTLPALQSLGRAIEIDALQQQSAGVHAREQHGAINVRFAAVLARMMQKPTPGQVRGQPVRK